MAIPEGSYSVDDVYLEEDYYAKPKEYFKLVTELIRSAYGGRTISLIDVGCAEGAYIAYAQRELDIGECLGVDYFEPLLERAREKVSHTEFVQGSLTTLEKDIDRKFDVCVCLGTVGLFDDTDDIVRNLMSVVAPGGSCFIYDRVNDNPVDVLMRYRVVDDEEAGDWTPAFNVRCMETYRRVASAIDPALKVEATDFRMPFPLERTDDPMRSWTIRTEENENQLTVGTRQLLDFKVVRISRP